jgi:hypothetical protein
MGVNLAFAIIRVAAVDESAVIVRVEFDRAAVVGYREVEFAIVGVCEARSQQATARASPAYLPDWIAAVNLSICHATSSARFLSARVSCGSSLIASSKSAIARS